MSTLSVVFAFWHWSELFPQRISMARWTDEISLLRLFLCAIVEGLKDPECSAMFHGSRINPVYD